LLKQRSFSGVQKSLRFFVCNSVLEQEILNTHPLLNLRSLPSSRYSREVENVFDAEFGLNEALGKRRREEFRREHEAFWNTGVWGPPNYIPPDPPVTARERAAFIAFHGPRTQPTRAFCRGKLLDSA
jgi:hypothetical protein